MDGPQIDYDALAGWAITAGLMLGLVAVVWWRRWRRAPQDFKDSFRRMPADWRSPPPTLPPRR